MKDNLNECGKLGNENAWSRAGNAISRIFMWKLFQCSHT